MIIGSHVHFGEKQLLGSLEEALSYGANAFMLYTGAPQNTFRTSIKDYYTIEAKKIMDEKHISMDHVICHAPYIINLANKEKSDSWNFSVSFLRQELDRCESLGIKYIVVHPGSCVKHTKEEGIHNIIDALTIILEKNSNVMILLETMAGKGSECGSTLEEIKMIMDGVDNKVGVCLDTCHLNDAGYKMDDFDSFLNQFDKIIGIKYIKCVHINDSKNPLGSHKDRHENIGIGTIGFDNILKVVNNPLLKDVPKILETPYVSVNDTSKEGLYPPYKHEIEMLKEGIFNSNLINDIRSFYK